MGCFIRILIATLHVQKNHGDDQEKKGQPDCQGKRPPDMDRYK